MNAFFVIGLISQNKTIIGPSGLYGPFSTSQKAEEWARLNISGDEEVIVTEDRLYVIASGDEAGDPLFTIEALISPSEIDNTLLSES